MDPSVFQCDSILTSSESFVAVTDEEKAGGSLTNEFLNTRCPIKGRYMFKLNNMPTNAVSFVYIGTIVIIRSMQRYIFGKLCSRVKGSTKMITVTMTCSTFGN